MLPIQLDRADFGKRLNELVSPSRPIQSVEFLRGRTKELERIEKAVFAPGRHIFVYGDRGVGKSSLAAAAANQLQSSDAEYVDVSCGPDSTLKSVVANIAYRALEISRVHRVRTTRSASVEYRFLKASLSREASQLDLHTEIRSLLDAVEVLREVAALHSERPVVVIDEFDRMTDPKERSLFADLVKQLGDKKIDITFFFTGVGQTLSELLGAHPSAIRQLETVELKKLDWTARWEIAQRAAAEFGVRLDQNISTRIAAVSDGYPYYVHLITEKLMWHLWECLESVSDVEWGHYSAAIRDAIESINGELRRPYEVAVAHRSDEFEEVLWACADSEYLDRSLKQVYSSYRYVMQQRPERAPVLDYDGFRGVVSKLRGPGCGEILVTSTVHGVKKNGWISYRENLLRGYVRMQAEAHGVELIGEAEAPRPVMHAPSRGRTGYFGPSIPKGVHLGKSR